ncbi:MAG: protease modulator HflC [Eubacteriales bacterium]|nr:protease modulator HflC [Eubacteriales bacterium]
MLNKLLKMLFGPKNKVHSGSPERPANEFSGLGQEGFNSTAKNTEYKSAAKRPSFKLKGTLLGLVLLIAVVVFVLSRTIFTVGEGEFAYITQFGKIVNVVEKPGLHFLTPFLQDYHKLNKKLLIYDVSPSEVLTADKKAMIVDSYALWRIADVQTFIRSVGAIPEFEKRLDASCYSVIKNVMGQLQQSQLISDEESSRDSLNNQVSEMVKENLLSYGVEVSRVEIRRYDLPKDNLSAVYDRMISERSQMAAQFKAEGLYEAAKIKNQSDKEYEVILAEAKAEAERIRGEAEGRYIEIMGEVYGNPKKAEFYQLLLELNNLEKSLANNPTVILSKDSVLGELLSDERFRNEP